MDLLAVRLYLTSRPDGAFGPPAVRSGREALRPYLSCLASGLGLLPTYRGAVLRGVDAPVRADLTGAVLTEPGPVGGLALSGEGTTADEPPPGGRLALTRLDEALEPLRSRPAAASAPWPPHCVGPIGTATPGQATAG